MVKFKFLSTNHSDKIEPSWRWYSDLCSYLNTKKSCHLSKTDQEAVWIEVKLKKVKPIFICSIYRPPSNRDIENVEKCTEYLSSCIDKLPKNSEVFIMGDFNVDISKTNSLSSLELCRLKVLSQYVTEPTRATKISSSMIDLVLSNSKFTKNCQVVDLGISDHSLVYIARDRVKVNRTTKTITSRLYKNFNDDSFLEDLFNTDWSNVLNADSPDDAANSFNENALKILDKHAPATRKIIRSGNPPWVDDNLLQGIKERDYLKKISSRTGLPQDWTRFNPIIPGGGSNCPRQISFLIA